MKAADSGQELKIYEPDNSIKKGFFAVYGEIFHELKNNRWLMYQLFKRDITAMHKQSFMGMLWLVVMPVFSVMTFVMLKRSGVMNTGDTGVPYALYVVSGLAIWQLFSTGIVSCTQSLVEAGVMIKIINFSKKSLVIAALGKSFIAFLVQIVLLLILFIVYRHWPQPGILLIPFILLPLVLLTLGLGLLLALLNSVMRDIGNMLAIAVTFLMFLTPVFYVRPTAGFLGEITRFNPLYYFISAGRDLLFAGSITELNGYLLASLASFLLFLVSLSVFHLTETRITERV